MKKEVYISVDIEATAGHQPGKYSMFQLGACLVINPDITFFTEIKLLNDNYDPRSLKVCGVTIEELKQRGIEPKIAMEKFAEWIEWARKLEGDKSRAVFTGFNAPFDWMFVDWYFHEFCGKNPFGISGLDMKAYYMGMMNSLWGETGKRKMRKQFPCVLRHTHNARDDAREQGELTTKIFEFNHARKAKLSFWNIT